jgi:hypothetical protein
MGDDLKDQLAKLMEQIERTRRAAMRTAIDATNEARGGLLQMCIVMGDMHERAREWHDPEAVQRERIEMQRKHMAEKAQQAQTMGYDYPDTLVGQGRPRHF